MKVDAPKDTYASTGPGHMRLARRQPLQGGARVCARPLRRQQKVRVGFRLGQHGGGRGRVRRSPEGSCVDEVSLDSNFFLFSWKVACLNFFRFVQPIGLRVRVGTRHDQQGLLARHQYRVGSILVGVRDGQSRGQRD